MLRRRLRQLIDEKAVKTAIVEAERGTRGEIRVSVSTFFWGDVTAAVEGRFRKGDFTGGLVHGVAEAGRVLALHFPREDASPNELPDDVDFGE